MGGVICIRMMMTGELCDKITCLSQSVNGGITYQRSMVQSAPFLNDWNGFVELHVMTMIQTQAEQ
jgi:hypothetical protein